MDMIEQMKSKTTDEKIAILAKAILELAELAARANDYDGETAVSNGVFLSLERELDALAALSPSS